MEIEEQNHIILVEDEIMTRELTMELLQELGFSVSTYSSADDFLNNLPSSKPSILLSDIYMPGATGLDLVKRLRELEDWKDIPILITTSSEEDVEAAFNAGANDYIEKPFDVNKHVPRIKFHIGAAANVQQLAWQKEELVEANQKLAEWSKTLEFKVEQRTKELSKANHALREEVNERRFLEDRLRYIASHDFLTRLFNRSKLEQHIDKCLSKEIDSNEPRSFLLYIDLDQFKVINEHFGHFAGDELLRQISELLLSIELQKPLIARLGGDEFAIVFQEDDIDSALKTSNKISHVINSHEFLWQEQAFIFTASCALMDFAENWLSSSHMLSMADTMIFELKLKGGNDIEIYHSGEDGSEQSRLELQWIPQINSAIKHDEFELYFQKIVHSKEQEREKAEILIRMRNSQIKNIVLPGQFIDVAEKFHLINKIDLWVLDRVCKYLAENQCPFDRLSVNLSGETITHRDYLKDVLACIDNYGLDGSQLCFEITETSALHDLRSTQNFIELLKSNTSCEIALDDFGTGQASYAYLKSVPFDVLKIDGIFIKSICDEVVDKKMVASLIEVAHMLDMKVVAECVENETILKQLLNMNVDWLQGFYLHTPEPLFRE